VLPRFLEFAEGSVLAAHNAPFDVGFLAAACHRCGAAWPRGAVIDTAMLARLVLGPDDVPNHKLATLSGHFAIQAGPCHRALADARATAGVLAGLLDLLASAGARAAEAGQPARPPARWMRILRPVRWRRSRGASSAGPGGGKWSPR
jgi:DNA polymerase III subunit epsilon